jgi:hypothetical protein
MMTPGLHHGYFLPIHYYIYRLPKSNSDLLNPRGINDSASTNGGFSTLGNIFFLDSLSSLSSKDSIWDFSMELLQAF